MTTRSANPVQLTGRDLGTLGFARLRDRAFDAVLELWRRRSSEGLQQKDLAERIGRDPAWVSRNLSASGNWTLKTIGELTAALDGVVNISIVAAEDIRNVPVNFDAYEIDGTLHAQASSAFVGTTNTQSAIAGVVETGIPLVYSVQASGASVS